jgi:hypothetical protein
MRSAVYVVWEVLEDLLLEADWPELPEAGPVRVWFGDPAVPPVDVPQGAETVTVIGALLNHEEEFATAGQISKDETFTVGVQIFSLVPGRTERQVRDRLCLLDAVVREVVMATTRAADRPAALCDVWLWGVTESRPVVGRNETGAVATCRCLNTATTSS